MRLGLLLVLVLATACTRDNPAFEGGTDGSDGGTSRGSTNGPIDGTEGSATSVSTGSAGTVGTVGTGASSNADGVDSTSMSTSLEGTTGPAAETAAETGCTSEEWFVAPTIDTFVVRSTYIACGTFFCNGVNFGAAPQGLIVDLEPGYTAYYLAAFDLSGLELPQSSISATLELVVESPMPTSILVQQVFPNTWHEGNGVGILLALPGEASWNAADVGVPWMANMGMGTFEQVLSGANDVGLENVISMEGQQSVAITIDDGTVMAWTQTPDTVHLAVTVNAGLDAAQLFSEESLEADAPRLHFMGC